MSDITDKIQQVATGPQSVTSDGTTVVQPDLSKLIEADKYLSQKAAAAKPWQALGFARISFPGSVR